MSYSNGTQEKPLQERLLSDITNEIIKVFKKHFPGGLHITMGVSDAHLEEMVRISFDYAWEDLMALSNKDQAAHGKAEYVYETYNSFKAVVHYRIANTIFNYKTIPNGIRGKIETIANDISQETLANTKIDINPAAKIGKRFIIDHGIDIAIGETCEIGDDCYMLQGVILGARGIADNPPGKRQPTLGNNVQIGAFARIFGPVKIGNNVIINPYCVVPHDVPSETKVVIVNQLQLSTPHIAGEKIEIYGIVPEDSNKISIYGRNFMGNISLSLVDENYNEIKGLKILSPVQKNNFIKFQIFLADADIKIQEIKEKAKIKIIFDETIIYVTWSLGLERALESLIKKEE